MHQKEKLYSIQQVSTKLNIPKPTLRFWEKEFEGTLQPLRTTGGQRRYTCEHIAIVEKINALKKAGLSLSEVKTKMGRIEVPETIIQRSGYGRLEGVDLLAEKVAQVVKTEIRRFLYAKPGQMDL